MRRLTGGVGAVEEHEVLILPVWTLAFGGKNVEFRNMGVTIEENKLVPHAGNIGMSLVNQFGKVVINFDDCFVVFE